MNFKKAVISKTYKCKSKQGPKPHFPTCNDDKGYSMRRQARPLTQLSLEKNYRDRAATTEQFIYIPAEFNFTNINIARSVHCFSSRLLLLLLLSTYLQQVFQAVLYIAIPTVATDSCKQQLYPINRLII